MALTDLIRNGTAGIATATPATELDVPTQTVAKVAVATAVQEKIEGHIDNLRVIDKLFSTIDEAIRTSAIDPWDADFARDWIKANQADREYLDQLQLLLQWCMTRAKVRR